MSITSPGSFFAPTLYFLVCMRTFKFYSLSKFQLFNTVLSTTVTMLCIRPSDFIHLIAASLEWETLQCSCLENSMARGTWRATVHGLQGVRHDCATNTHTCTLLPASPYFPQPPTPDPSNHLSILCFSELNFCFLFHMPYISHTRCCLSLSGLFHIA